MHRALGVFIAGESSEVKDGDTGEVHLPPTRRTLDTYSKHQHTNARFLFFERLLQASLTFRGCLLPSKKYPPEGPPTRPPSTPRHVYTRPISTTFHV